MNEIDETILKAKLFLNQYSPPRKQSTDEVLAGAKSRLNQFRDYIEEDSALFWPEAPRGMYWSKDGFPMQKGFHSRK